VLGPGAPARPLRAPRLPAEAPEPDVTPPAGYWRRAGRRLARDRLTLVVLAVLLGILLACAGADIITGALGVSPDRTALQDRFEPPSAQHLLGTDHLGRDVLARLLYGGRVSLAIGVLGALLTMTIGVALGMMAAVLRGPVDDVAMWAVNTLQSIPVTFFLLAAAFLFSPSVFWIVILLAFLAWPDTCRLVRGQSLSLESNDYILAARALGASHGDVMRRHILPNVLPFVVVAMTIDIGELILFESALSFLGLGVKPPTATWGRMLDDAQAQFAEAPHLVLLPGIAITLAVLCFYVLGDGLRDALDPRSAR